MFKLIRLIVRIAFILFIGLLVLAFFTNPDMEEFKKQAKEQLNSKVNEQTNNPALGYIAELGLEFTDQIIEKMVIRKNYYVCSVFTISLPDGDYSYLGAYHTFVPLQDKNPLDVFGQDQNTSN
jgi:hypothetical protein